jgi:hypothetical protein
MIAAAIRRAAERVSVAGKIIGQFREMWKNAGDLSDIF